MLCVLSIVNVFVNTLLGEWHGHLLLLDRRQRVLLCHDLMPYMLFFLRGCAERKLLS